jgi:hypothetical protein
MPRETFAPVSKTNDRALPALRLDGDLIRQHALLLSVSACHGLDPVLAVREFIRQSAQAGAPHLGFLAGVFEPVS